MIMYYSIACRFKGVPKIILQEQLLFPPIIFTISAQSVLMFCELCEFLGQVLGAFF